MSEEIATHFQESSAKLTNHIKNEYRRHLIESKTVSPVKRIVYVIRNIFSAEKTLILDQTERRAIKQELRTAEELSHKLIEEQLIIDEDLADLASVLGEQLREEFDIPGLALVLLGSGVHGGRQVRKLFSTETSGDFDWGLVSDVDLGLIPFDHPNSITELLKFVEQGVEAYSREKGLDLHSCESMNGSQQREQNVDSVNGLLKKILTSSSSGLALLARRLVFFFEPSFPAEVNENNQKNVLNTLKILSNIDLEKWRTLVALMIELWQSMHVIKRKHFLNNERDYAKSALENRKHAEIKKNSSLAMSQRFREMLEATGGQS